MYKPGYKPQQQGGGKQQQQGGGNMEQEQGGAVTFGPAFPFPVEAIISATGERVTLLGPCDWENHSLANYGNTKADGKQVIVTWEEVTITDHRLATLEPQQRGAA